MRNFFTGTLTLTCIRIYGNSIFVDAVVDFIIERLKTYNNIPPHIVEEFVARINQLRAAHINVLDIINERVKNLRPVGEELSSLLSQLLELVPDSTETTAGATVATK